MTRKKKTPTSMRIRGDLLTFIATYADERDSDKTEITTELYLALSEGRLFVEPRSSPNPFPGDPPLFPTLPSQE